jgi:hypothetical protein
MEKLEQDGVVTGLRAILLGDRLTNVGFQQADLVILGGLTTANDTQRAALIEAAYRQGRDF